MHAPSSLLMSTSRMNSAPPVRRRTRPPSPYRGDGSASPSTVPLSSRAIDNASAQANALENVGSRFRSPPGEVSLRESRVEEDGSSFNGALYSLKAFGIATALIVAGGAASVWGVKTYLGVKDVSGICTCRTKLIVFFGGVYTDTRVCVCNATDNHR